MVKTHSVAVQQFGVPQKGNADASLCKRLVQSRRWVWRLRRSMNKQLHQ